jgi:hypothetical protein
MRLAGLFFTLTSPRLNDVRGAAAQADWPIQRPQGQGVPQKNTIVVATSCFFVV